MSKCVAISSIITPKESPVDILSTDRSRLQSSEEEDWEGEMQLQLQTRSHIKDIPQRERTWQYYSTNHFVTWSSLAPPGLSKTNKKNGGVVGGGCFLGVGRGCYKEVRQANKPCQVPTSLVREQLRNAVLQVRVRRIGRSSAFSRVLAMYIRFARRKLATKLWSLITFRR
jgi:hypothetical protein